MYEEHVAERFKRLLDIYRKPNGSVWGGRDLERETGGLVSRSYVSNLRNGRIGSPGLDKLEAIAGAMGFQPQLWFAQETGNGREPGKNQAVEAALDNATIRSILDETVRLNMRERRLLLNIARQIGRR